MSEGPSTEGTSTGEAVPIDTKEQAFSIDFHPSQPLVVAGLITGQLKLYDLSDAAAPSRAWSVRPHQGACRAVRSSV